MKTIVVVALAASLGAALPVVASAQEYSARPESPATVMRGLVYQPHSVYRGGYYHRSAPAPFSQGYFDLHGGVFRFSDTDAHASDFGGKLGLTLAPGVRLGALMDWQRRAESQTELISKSPGPGGTTITNKVDIGSSSSNLIPFMGFLEAEPMADQQISPYVGVAAGYDWLTLHASRADIPVPFDANYGGFGWQLWGGAAMKLSPMVKLTGEVYGNFGEVSRDAFDTTLNQEVKESVKVDGVGVRGGLQFGF